MPLIRKSQYLSMIRIYPILEAGWGTLHIAEAPSMEEYDSNGENIICNDCNTANCMWKIHF